MTINKEIEFVTCCQTEFGLSNMYKVSWNIFKKMMSDMPEVVDGHISFIDIRHHTHYKHIIGPYLKKEFDLHDYRFCRNHDLHVDLCFSKTFDLDLFLLKVA